MRDPISSKAYALSLGASIANAFKAWKRMTPVEWATEIYRLPSGGKFSFNYAPYSLKMFESLFDRHVKETSFQVFSRGLKSTVILLALGYCIDQDPRRILYCWPTNSNAEKFSKDILNGELFDTTPCLNYLGTAGKKRTGENTILHKNYPGGVIDLVGLNAPGDLRRAKANFIVIDEKDAIQTTVSDEGDVVAIVNKRGDEYPDTIRVSASYPALKLLDPTTGAPLPGHSRINTDLMRSDENHWYSTCVKCGGEPYVMHTSHIVYEEGSEKDARMECPRCKALLTDPQRHEMAHGQGFDNWRETRPFAGFRGFQASAMLWPHPTDPIKMPGGALQLIAEQKTAAKNSDNPRRSMRVFINTVDAEPCDPRDESEKPPEWKAIHDRREDYTVVPQKASFLTAFADLQKNRIEVGWRAFGREEESWGMDYVVLDGYIRDREVWCELVRELGRVFPHESGATLSLGQAFIDGGNYSEDAYRFFQYLRAALAPYHPQTNPLGNVAAEYFKGVPQETLNRVYGHVRASKGVGKHGAPVVEMKMSTVAFNLKGHKIGTWEVKDRIYSRLRKFQPGAHCIHYNENYPENFFQMLVSEKVTIEYDGGTEIRKYENPDDARNEALDIEVGCYAAFCLRPRNFDQLEKKIADDAEAARKRAAALKAPASTLPHLPMQVVHSAPPQQNPVPRRSVLQKLRAW